MIKANGLEISNSEYNLLKKLVEASDAKAELAESIAEGGEPCARRARHLDELRLLEGISKGEILDLEYVTDAGNDFVDDVESTREANKQDIWENRTFQIVLSLLTLVVSAFFGWVAGHFS